MTYMFNRLTDGLVFYTFDRWSYTLTMLRGCSFNRKIDGPIRIILDRLINETYCTLAKNINL